MNDPSADLRQRVRAGDPDAFGAVFDAWSKSVYNHAFRLTGDWSVAEDVMSQTFLEAWRSRAGIAPDGGSLVSWLLGIATNLARSHRRSGLRHQLGLVRLRAGAGVVPDFADQVGDRIDDAARVAALRRVLSRLNGPELEVLALTAWSGLSYAQAAEALAVPVGTVRSRLSRVRAKLLRLTDRELAAISRQPSLTTTSQAGAGNARMFPADQEACR